jgi:hypothetical protein
MSTTTSTNPGRCDVCGDSAATRDNSLRCPDCEYRSLLGDEAEIEATLEVLGAAIEHALDYVHPDDLRELVNEKERKRTSLLSWPVRTVTARVLELQGARTRARYGERETESSRTMMFEGRQLDHLRRALVAGLASPAETIMDRPEGDELAQALKHFDDARAALNEAGLDSHGGDVAYLDLDQHGELILAALLASAAEQRDQVSDAAGQGGADEATFDEGELETLTSDYAEMKKAIAELKARGIGVVEEARELDEVAASGGGA